MQLLNSSTTLILLIIFLFTTAFLFFFFYKWFSKASIKPKLQKEMLSQKEYISVSIKAVKSDIRFSDIAGLNDVKSEIQDIIDYLQNPQKYIDFGIKLPRGILLVGPPGVGKTLLAKAVAGEADGAFFYQSGASFVHIYAGMGPKRVKDLFEEAKKYKSAIIFIDEIDAVGKSRDNLQNDEREATLNQLLIEMDGFEDTSSIVVIGATNRAKDLDEALLRSGRFDRRVYIKLPNIEDREEILKLYLKNKKIDPSINLKEIAKICSGFSASSISTFVNEAALYALKRGSDKLEYYDFEKVFNKVKIGKKEEKFVSEYEREIEANYQAAKALITYLVGKEFPSYSLFENIVTTQDDTLYSKSELKDRLKILLSGYVANSLIFHEQFTNSKNDLLEAKNLAKQMVYDFSMGEKIVANNIDVELLLEETIDELEQILKDKEKALKEIAKILAQDETISYKQIGTFV